MVRVRLEINFALTCVMASCKGLVSTIPHAMTSNWIIVTSIKFFSGSYRQLGQHQGSDNFDFVFIGNYFIICKNECGYLFYMLYTNNQFECFIMVSAHENTEWTTQQTSYLHNMTNEHSFKEQFKAKFE